MYARILDDTGLVIGWKSIKNYSLFVLSPAAAKSENPSVATLDTLSRYVMVAPMAARKKRPFFWVLVLGGVVAGGVVFVGAVLLRKGPGIGFADHFQNVSADSLYRRGWWEGCGQ